MRYHKAHLTRRLILDISADSEIEENMVEWLRVRSDWTAVQSESQWHLPFTLLSTDLKSCRNIKFKPKKTPNRITWGGFSPPVKTVYLWCHVSWQEVGMPADYVNKLARMFQDIKVSEDLNQSFKEMHKHNKLALPGER